MKKIIVVFLLSLMATGCDQITALMNTADEQESAVEHALKHADPNYVCPMHPQIIKGEEGSCPICGMDLVEQEVEPEPIQESAVEHALKHADPTYVCPMHPQIVKGEEGSCPICGMDLVEQEVEPEPIQESAVEHALKHADPTYVCPMHPQIVQGEEGSCPICGMDLVKQDVEPMLSSTETEDNYPAIRVTSSVVQNMGVRTAKVTLEDISKHITTVGRVEYDEDSLRHVHVRAAGWVEKLKIRTVGEPVKRGDVLFSYYAPEILTAQQELAIAGGGRMLRNAARERLRLLAVPESVIKRVESKGKTQRLIPVLAPTSGVVSQINFREGMYLKPEMTLYTIADLSSVWINVDVFEYQMDWVSVGSEAEIRVEALPGKSWKGKIDYVYPELESGTRTLKVRLRFDNSEGDLKPNMFADVVIWSPPKKDAITIPREAVIVSGNSSRVVTRLSEGGFQPVTIETGLVNDDRVEILSGLEVGQEIVVSGQFLIDSESNLQASFRRMRSAAAESGAKND